MAKEYELKVRKIQKVKTPFRNMVTNEFPVKKSVQILKKLRKYEPRSMSGQPLALWDRAAGINVFDKYGNKWLDFSSGVLVANAGHSNPEIKKAIIKQTQKGLLHNYCFPSEIRATLIEKIAKLAPYPLKKVFLLTTGAESTEVAIKLSRTWGLKIGGQNKITIVSFSGAFHGRTMGSQMIGGSPDLKKWIVNLDKDMVQAPFPYCYRCPWGKDKYQNCDVECFNNFVKFLKHKKLDPAKNIAGVISETYQGGNATFMPKKFAQLLRAFCNKSKALLVFDEVQAGFGRTGKMFGFQHYDIVPDIACCGKGISSSLPLSAVIGRPDIMDMYEPNTMTSTHTGNPVCSVAAIANIDYLVKHKLAENAAKIGKYLEKELLKLVEKYPDVMGCAQGKGLVYTLHVVKSGTKDPDGDLAHDIVGRCVEKGLMLFSPVGTGSASIKLTPPLTINETALKDGIKALDEAIADLI
ncbi:MAG: aspartate aminotransferase family protein [Elusimicrobia bacterium]|nr:aspartate aminotransferase family protein [Elusimicrobiota bacterium]MBU2614660.1 aspartate aminotransferase family protein [Elusimicrobiota bacterium]